MDKADNRGEYHYLANYTHANLQTPPDNKTSQHLATVFASDFTWGYQNPIGAQNAIVPDFLELGEFKMGSEMRRQKNVVTARDAAHR